MLTAKHYHTQLKYWINVFPGGWKRRTLKLLYVSFRFCQKHRYILAGERGDISSWTEELTLINYREKTSAYFFLILSTP